LVDDVRKALWRIAMLHRDTALAQVIGVTGSAGKTSVKEVLAQVLAIRGHTDRNHLNLNNQIGLPLSMLAARADAAFWVMELGISEAGDMDELGLILRPDTGLILNVGEAHVLGLGERGVAACKIGLLSYLQPSGLAVVSSDYSELNNKVDRLLPELDRRHIRRLRFSASRPEADCRAEYLGPDPEGKGRYRVFAAKQDFTVHTPFRGAFGSENVAAIAAVAMAYGLRHEEMEEGFALARLPDRRFSSKRYGPFTLLDDSYNSNPLSAQRMIAAAAAMAGDCAQPLFLVMGEMLELGTKAETAHEALGKTMAEAGPALVFWKGGCAGAVERGLRKAGYREGFYPVAGGQDFSLLLEEIAPVSGLFLFKGSRANRLENLVEIFRARIAPGNVDGGPDAV
jgi:UDP-N-acetylmuramoyl-tripeptide--D-alanyl-D-alanine ligase